MGKPVNSKSIAFARRTPKPRMVLAGLLSEAHGWLSLVTDSTSLNVGLKR